MSHSNTPNPEPDVTLQAHQDEYEYEHEHENKKQKDEDVKYRQYLIDRTNGRSNLDDSKPPCSACYVPLPVVWFADYIEQNRLFERLGSFGIFDASNLKARKICIGLGLVANIVGAILSLYVLFSISTDFNTIWATGFTHGFISTSSGQGGQFPYSYEMRVGMKAVAVKTLFQDNRTLASKQVTTFDEFCDAASIVVPQEDCGGCDDASGSMIVTLFISFIMCFPSITTSVLRLYPHYDCNCQKVFASFAAIISCGFAVYTFVLYQFRCFRSFGFGYLCLDDDGNMFERDSETLACRGGETSINRLFSAGPGWLSLSIACGLKILDMLFNFAIPTPTICRNHEEQREYELLASSEDNNAKLDESTPDPVLHPQVFEL